MLVIRDKNGNVIGKSKNLAGIRQKVGKESVKVVAIDEIADGEGKLMILFKNGDSFETNFASYDVLRHAVGNWRNLYGTELVINGEKVDVISNKNRFLNECS